MTTQIGSRARVGWGFWSRWVSASALGLAAGWAVSSTTYLVLGPTEATVASSAAKLAIFGVDGVVFGVGMGIAQWLVLRRHVDRVGAWARAAAVSHGVGFALTGALEMASPRLSALSRATR